MGLGLLLVPALAGYFVQIRMNVFRYDTLRQSGHHVFFRSALTGGILALLAHALVYLLGPRYPTMMALIVRVFDFEYSATAIVSLLLAVAIVLTGNIFWNQDQAAIKSAKKHGELMTVALARTIDSRSLVEVVLDNKQIYFGKVLEIEPGISKDIDFTIVPILRGYRDDGTGEYVLSKNYIPILGRGRLSSNFLKTTLSTSRVISIRFFHEFPSVKFGSLPVDGGESKARTTVTPPRYSL